jgi:hypothetical protein
MSEPAAIQILLTHAGGSSRPCDVVGVEAKLVRGRPHGAASIRVRWGVAGVYTLNPLTGKVDGLAGQWSAEPAECQRVIDAWNATKKKAG